MRFKGKIKKIDKIIVSDPSYNEKVTCRYENNHIKANDWVIDVVVNEIEEPFESPLGELILRGQEIFIMIKNPEDFCHMHDDGSFTNYESDKMRKFDIGMDTACVALGINENATQIKECTDIWQPAFALNTLTDGSFGKVIEGYDETRLKYIFISGYLDEDTGYTFEDIKKYFEKQFEIKDIEIEKQNDISKDPKLEKIIDKLKNEMRIDCILYKDLATIPQLYTRIEEKLKYFKDRFKENTKQDERLKEYFSNSNKKEAYSNIEIARGILEELKDEENTEKMPYTRQQEIMIEEYTKLEKAVAEISKFYQIEYEKN